MLSRPLPGSSFKRLKPADWGFGMTVCIAAITAENEIVAASDHMLSMAGGDFTAESATLKDRGLNADWTILFAGNDIGVIPGVFRRITSGIGKWEELVDVGVLARVLGEAFQAERLARAVELYLTPNNTTLDELYRSGPKKFGHAGSAVLRERIEHHKLDCEFLVFGFDGHSLETRAAHLLHLADPGIVKEYDMPGYWAIGTGAYLALSTLAGRQHSFLSRLPTVVYDVCEAKFAAESAFGVGRETFVTITDPARRWRVFEPTQIQMVRGQCEKLKPPRSNEALIAIKAWADVDDWARGPAIGKWRLASD